jgi:hypothetical protein
LPTDDPTLDLPPVGFTQLRAVSPTVLELELVNTKFPDPATVAVWNWVDASGRFHGPSVSNLVVTVSGQPVTVQGLGFKRRPLYAPLAHPDLRIGNFLYVQLAAPLADGQSVQVQDPDGLFWSTNLSFSLTVDSHRYSPALHVNQEGYVPTSPKQAMVGYYLGSLGEMDIPTAGGYQLVDTHSGAVVFQGPLGRRPDSGYNYLPTPYQKVYAADFSAFTTPGTYYLEVPGLGRSLPFRIDDGVVLAFARAYALGLYHQRCGTSNALPFTRFVHGACHTAAASVPLPAADFAFTWRTISNYAILHNPDNPGQTAPLLTNAGAQLYPFVKTGTVDVSGGHHDAGDYSKYTINSATLVHYLVFAVDALAGVAKLDNLGIPESGDGISDVLQEAKWEADFLAKLQDADGGFYFLVYPRNREYEQDVLPDHGDPQVVWPKTTAVTAAGVAALAQCASSPLFKATFPEAASNYLAKAQLGWQFLTNAIAKYGKAGAYQKITHYGDDFTHNDELAWAACELFLATGDPAFQQTLLSWFDPASPSTWRWGWWHMYGSYGNAIRSYAFAAKTGRLSASQLDPTFLSKCQAEIKAAAQAALAWSQQNAYGTSFPPETKAVMDAGWYFSSDQAFDLTVAYQLDPQPAYLEAEIKNMNYEGGCNPVNVTYVTGLGWKRQREIVSQYAQNDRRIMPPSGLPLGNIQKGFINGLYYYGPELTELCFPKDNTTNAPYPFYDRWGDSFNVTTEFVVLNQARSLGSLAFWAAQTAPAAQGWSAASGQILVPDGGVSLDAPVTVTLAVPGLDLSQARVVWEARDQQPAYGSSYTLTPTNNGLQWVEAEAQWPDGRRVFIATSFEATNTLPNVAVIATDHTASVGTGDTGMFTFTRSGSTNDPLLINFQLTGTAVKFIDYRTPQGDMPSSVTIPAGAYSTSLTIVAVANSTLANPETIMLTLASNATYNVGAHGSDLITVINPPPNVNPPPSVPVVTVTASVPQTTWRGSAPGAFTFDRTGDYLNTSLVVSFTLEGTATPAVDYSTSAGNLPNSVTFPVGASVVDLTITPAPSGSSTNTVTVHLTLVPATAYGIGTPGSAAVSIVADTPILQIAPLSGSGVLITWASVTGKNYQVLYKNNWTDNNWSGWSEIITAVGPSTTWWDAFTGASQQRFYAVEMIQW